MKKTYALLAVLLLAVSARAIELSLEENRGDRGSVGYVDLQRLFADSPDAQKAKEGFEDLVRQAEERVNLRKAELLKLHHELDLTRADREDLARVLSSTAAASGVSTSTSAAIALSTSAPASVAVSTASASVAASATKHPELALPGMSVTAAAPTAPPVAVSTAAPAVARSTSAPASVAVSTAARVVAAPAPAHPEMALPGMSPTVASTAAPAVALSTTAAAPDENERRKHRKDEAPAAVLTSTGIVAAAALFPAAPAPVPVVTVPAGPTPVQRLLEFDSKIIKLQADIAGKESELTHEHDRADQGLLNIESRKTDQVLARIYRAVSTVARNEGVSVVIDKTSILYGQPAVDLTDKVLKYLKENPQQ